jgi:hypothetical protein
MAILESLAIPTCEVLIAAVGHAVLLCATVDGTAQRAVQDGPIAFRPTDIHADNWIWIVNAHWPKHSCFDAQYRALEAKVLPIIKAGADPASGTFKPFAGLKERMGALALSKGLPAPHENPPAPAASSKAARAEHFIKRMDAMDEELSLIGIVRELIGDTSKLRAVYAGIGELGQKVLGLPAASKVVQVTVVDTRDEPHESYTCLVDKGKMEPAIKPGVMVFVLLKGYITPSPVWIVKEINAI